MEYDPDSRRAWRQWDAAERHWREALCNWTRCYQQLLRQQFARRLLVTTLEALMQATQAEAPERQALRAQRPPRPEYPAHCRGLRCGAMTRAGTPCQRRDLGAGARCKLHGGRSTGPKTPTGKQRAAANGFGTPHARTS
jgi:hypothetical protein